MIGHNREAGNRLYAIPRIVKGFDDIDKNPRNRTRLKIMACRIADHPRKIRKALSALQRDHIKIWPLIIKTFQSNAHESVLSPYDFIAYVFHHSRLLH